MKVAPEKKIEEAMERMRSLGIIDDAIDQFRRGNPVLVSEPPIGGLYYADDELQKRISDFEAEYNALVYLVVRAYTSFGKMDSLIFVSDHEEEWDYDAYDIQDGILMSYTINYDMPDCSEFGSIVYYQTAAGSILREF